MEKRVGTGFNINFAPPMKRRVFQVYISVCFAAVISGCAKENMCDCVKSTGSIIKEIRTPGDFDKLEVRKNVVVTLYQDSVNYIELEAGSHLMDLIRTDVENGTLKITNDNTCNWVRSYDIEVHAAVHLKKLSRIEHYGSEEISCSNTLVTDVIDIFENNSADIHLQLDAKQVFARQMIGGGDIYLSGKAGFSYNYGGSFGYVYAQDLVSDSVQVDHRGTGEVHVHPVSWLGVYIADRGNVYYSGEPVVSSVITGTGKLYHE
jgi:hypothetical protein